MSGFVQGFFSGKAQKKASREQTRAIDQATGEQRRQFDLTRADYAPWMESGRNALARLDRASAGDMSDFFKSPDYEFRRTEGARSLERSAAARGGAFSGNALKALDQYNSNLAAGEYNNWWNRQAGVAGLGQNATNASTAFGTQTTNNISDLLVGRGNARASGIIGADAAFWNRYDTQTNKALNFFGTLFGAGGSFGGSS